MVSTLRHWYNNCSLGIKFTMILAIVFLVGTIIGGLVLYQGAQRRAQDEITGKAEVLIESMNAVRRYTSGHVNPLVKDALYTEADFIPESVPGYSARTVFEEFRSSEEFDKFFYKEATLNPTNSRNQADDFEIDLVA